MFKVHTTRVGHVTLFHMHSVALCGVGRGIESSYVWPTLRSSWISSDLLSYFAIIIFPVSHLIMHTLLLGGGGAF